MEVMEPKNTDDPTKPNSKQRSRYHRLVMERFYAMLAGNRFSELRKMWLARLNRDGLFQNMDDWVVADGELRKDSPGLWWELQSDVASISE